ncbi:Gfo/Idh/MocA family protein [Yunchengibacter salinarum]|uniref:Gfo/Idh/MocA family protein n=1 Tax=Yunchengibacter salinarum TaxID=3133399 RepID=UPI0035B5B792
MRIAAVGVGKRAVTVLNLLTDALPDARVIACVDPDGGMIPALRRADGLTVHDDLPHMLDGETADLLFVGSPNHLHLDHIAAGLEAGLRVFTEKPAVISLAQTWRLCDLLARHGADRVMVGLVLRYAPIVRQLMDAIHRGWIGPIASIEASELIEPDHGAFFRRDWRRISALSGGFMLEKCCHDLDLYQWVTGERPVQVASFGGRQALSGAAPASGPLSHGPDKPHLKTRWNADGAADIVDHQSALLRFGSGATMTFHTNMNAPDEQRRFCIVGARGMAEGDLHRGVLTVTDAATGEARLSESFAGEPSGHYGADEMMARDLAAHLSGTGESLPVSILDALEAGIVALSLDEARRSGSVVDLRPHWQRLDAYGLRPPPGSAGG